MTEETILIRGGMVIDPANERSWQKARRRSGFAAPPVSMQLAKICRLADQPISLSTRPTCLVIPGLVDTHVSPIHSVVPRAIECPLLARE